jgi:hypothetical protein
MPALRDLLVFVGFLLIIHYIGVLWRRRKQRLKAIERQRIMANWEEQGE